MTAVGATSIDTVYVGDTAATALYVGDVQVWTASEGFTATVASTLKKASAALVGTRSQAGEMSAAEKKTVASFAGREHPKAALASTAKKASAALVGSTGRAGTVAAMLKKAAASAAGTTIVVTDFGAVGDGTTDDTAAINAAIAAGPGVVYFPAGTYKIVSPGGDPGDALQLDVAGTTLRLAAGATVRMAANNYTHYCCVRVTADDCAITGGTWEGDVATHTGSTGEWGHVISVDGADRCYIHDTTVKNAWGDGIFVYGNAADTTLENVTSDSNRRQGLSVVWSQRTTVIGGTYKNTGAIAFTGPGCGIDIEPDSGTGDVTDCYISGATLIDNRGGGFWSNTNGETVTATVEDTTSDNAGITSGINANCPGFTVNGATNTIDFTNCTATHNTLYGFWVDTDATTGVKTFTECDATNSKRGFYIDGDNVALDTCTTSENLLSGFYIQSSSASFTADSCTSTHDARQATSYVAFDNYAPSAHFTDCVATAGSPTPAVHGYANRASGTGSVFTNCTGSGFTGTLTVDQDSATWN